ncbi:hypothetical protein L873DRAFT_1002425 [Choiromyces venosus 120613-1]|uniref:Uncharacterized protein n=1 Tax=Choiromyces venosus 120613-1 TaxID=1336337 RepID=A0A3N4JZ47_9PEZI|nr:hypothetical protein L873DRAFT_1002425 [Choiromyces venosus 120613-1]
MNSIFLIPCYFLLSFVNIPVALGEDFISGVIFFLSLLTFAFLSGFWLRESLRPAFICSFVKYSATGKKLGTAEMRRGWGVRAWHKK